MLNWGLVSQPAFSLGTLGDVIRIVCCDLPLGLQVCGKAQCCRHTQSITLLGGVIVTWELGSECPILDLINNQKYLATLTTRFPFCFFLVSA